MFRGKNGEMGIGVLILFIAMILVAAVAAGVLIQTATNLQSRALETGTRSTRQVSTAISTVLIYGQDGLDGSFDQIRQNIKLVGGSDIIKLNDSLISVDTNNGSVDMVFNASKNCSGSVPRGYFRAVYLKNGTGHVDGYIVVGDIVQLCYNTPRSLTDDELIRINFIPKVGSMMTVRLTTPAVIKTTRVFLYP